MPGVNVVVAVKLTFPMKIENLKLKYKDDSIAGSKNWKKS